MSKQVSPGRRRPRGDLFDLTELSMRIWKLIARSPGSTIEPPQRSNQFADAFPHQGEALSISSVFLHRQVRVFCERVGGGFGAKQEIITEDICAFATLRTGKPVKLGVHARRGILRRHYAPSDEAPRQGRSVARWHADGSSDSIRVRTPAPTAPMAPRPCFIPPANRSLSIAVRTKKSTPTRFTPTPSLRERFAATDCRRPFSRSKCAMDELARGLKMDPFEFRRRNVIRPPDPMLSLDELPE